MSGRLEQLQRMLAQEPTDTFLQYAIGMEYFSAEEFDKALTYFNCIIDSKPDYLAAYYQTGKCYEELKQIKEAQCIYMKGIELAERQNKNKTLNELREALFLLED
ncbi:MAG: tetratricopeptide repeat protein [Bacteroidia bacterium]